MPLAFIGRCVTAGREAGQGRPLECSPSRGACNTGRATTCRAAAFTQRAWPRRPRPIPMASLEARRQAGEPSLLAPKAYSTPQKPRRPTLLAPAHKDPDRCTTRAPPSAAGMVATGSAGFDKGLAAHPEHRIVRNRRSRCHPRPGEPAFDVSRETSKVGSRHHRPRRRLSPASKRPVRSQRPISQGALDSTRIACGSVAETPQHTTARPTGGHGADTTPTPTPCIACRSVDSSRVRHSHPPPSLPRHTLTHWPRCST